MASINLKNMIINANRLKINTLLNKENFIYLYTYH